MKKILGVFLGVLMLFAAAADIYAATTVGGAIDVRGRWRENNNDLNADRYGSTAMWEQKVNLWLDAKIAEGLSGYVELQSGVGSSDGFITWGSTRGKTDSDDSDATNADKAPNSLLNENQSLGYMQIRYAYIDFMIPKTPVGIKIGHFPVVLGHSIWTDTFYWGTDGLLISSSPIKELMIGFGAFKVYEAASNTNRSDIDMYTLLASYTFMPKNTAGFNLSYLVRSGAGNGNAQASAYWSGLSADGVAFNAINDMKFWNLMLTVDGSLDFGLNYKFEIDKQFGKLDDTEVAGGVDLKGTGLAFLLGASYGIADIVEVKFNAAYGSGDKCATWSGTATGDACSSTGDKFEGYFSFNNYGYTMVYEDIVGQKTAVGILGSGDFGLYNTMYINVGAGVTPLKDMSVGLDIYYLRAMKEFYYGQKKNIGWEVDLNFGYQIYKNLKWTFLAGYFLPGNHYKALSSTDTVKDDAAWAFEQVLSLGF